MIWYKIAKKSKSDTLFDKQSDSPCLVYSSLVSAYYIWGNGDNNIEALGDHDRPTWRILEMKGKLDDVHLKMLMVCNTDIVAPRTTRRCGGKRRGGGTEQSTTAIFPAPLSMSARWIILINSHKDLTECCRWKITTRRSTRAERRRRRRWTSTVWRWPRMGSDSSWRGGNVFFHWAPPLLSQSEGIWDEKFNCVE